jgi:hypothetical protein
MALCSDVRIWLSVGCRAWRYYGDVYMINQVTEEELAEIEARANAAAEGPWIVVDTFQGQESGVEDAVGFSVVQPYIEFENSGLSPENARFIAAARSDIPRLITEIKRLRSDNAKHTPKSESLKVD